MSSVAFGDKQAACRYGVGVLLLYCGFLFFYGLGSGELYRTESLRAILAAEFLRSGNWLVPTLYGEPFFTKPPGMYAAIAVLSWPAGQVTEWTARAPSAIAATLTVLAFYAVFRRRLGAWQGLVTALILPVSFMWLDKASAAEIDMMQVAWVTGAIFAFLKALEIHEGGGEQAALWVWWLAALLCVAGGVLTKWTAPVFFYGAVIAMLWCRGRLRLLLGRHHLIAALLGASVCLTWAAAAVLLAGWQPFYETVSHEALVRLSPHYRHGPYSWRELCWHPIKVLATALPWSIPALLTLRPGFARLLDDGAQRLLQLMHCWLWPNLLFWTVIPEHATRHSFPMIPAISGLSAFVICGWMARPGWRFPLPATILACTLVFWVGTKLVFVHAVSAARIEHREARVKGEAIASLVPSDQVLYLFRLKDEGILFYYRRPALRMTDPGQLPDGLAYCILNASEWENWRAAFGMELVRGLEDEQGDPIYLVRKGAAHRASSTGLHANDRASFRHQGPHRRRADTASQGRDGGSVSAGLGVRRGHESVTAVLRAYLPDSQRSRVPSPGCYLAQRGATPARRSP
jgi:4-amino-4-deoxy-L-arabinose transferase-like glycosyltransferase